MAEKTKELRSRMVKGKTIQLYGFPSSVRVSDAKRFLQRPMKEVSML
jgi:hypothetical protein